MLGGATKHIGSDCWCPKHETVMERKVGGGYSRPICHRSNVVSPTANFPYIEPPPAVSARSFFFFFML